MKEKIILVADDDSEFCDSLKDVLELDGYVCFSAGTCGDALNLARERRPFVALLGALPCSRI
jgi:DNA-binding response OmpR family regulator